MQKKTALNSGMDSSKKSGIGLSFVIGLALFLTLTAIALFQPGRPDPLSASTSFESFFYPRERNAFLRLPAVSAVFNDVFALRNTDLVWAVADAGFILHSRDAGETWERQFLAGSETESAQDANVMIKSFLPISSAHAAEDGAVTKEPPQEQKIDFNQSQQPQQQAPIPSANLGVRQEDLAGTKDVPPDSEDEKALIDEFEQFSEQSPLSNQNDIDLSNEPTVTVTPPPSSIPVAPDLLAVHFVDELNGVIAGSNGTILKTSNGGESWQKIETGMVEDLESIDFIGGNGLVAGREVILASNDFGATWIPGDIRHEFTRSSGIFPSEFDILQVKFTGTNSAVAITRAGRFLRSNDRGQTWESDSASSTADLPGFVTTCSITNSTTAFCASSRNGKIFKTTDAGKSWPEVFEGVQNRSGDSLYIYEITFFDGRTGMALGENGLVLKTIDGGSKWQEEYSLSLVSNLNALSFSDANRAIAVGNLGVIFKSTDFGDSWHLRTRPLLISLDAFDAQRLLAVGLKGTILKSDDGGSSWEPTTQNINADLIDIKIINEQVAIAVGTKGTILRSSNRGDSWTPVESNTNLTLFRMDTGAENSA